MSDGGTLGIRRGRRSQQWGWSFVAGEEVAVVAVLAMVVAAAVGRAAGVTVMVAMVAVVEKMIVMLGVGVAVVQVVRSEPR